MTQRSRRVVLCVLVFLTVSACVMVSSDGHAKERKIVLCENQTFSQFQGTLFTLEGDEVADPTIQKIIRNCRFEDSVGKGHVIVLKDATNVLIEGCVFHNLRSGKPGKDREAISIRPGEGGRIDQVIVRENHFDCIGSDAIQMGETGPDVYEVLIKDNVFIGSEGCGENAIDIKATRGPITIVGNRVTGFRPCESPKYGGTQDCSGSHGHGITIHGGNRDDGAEQSTGPSRNILLQRNDFEDNTVGLNVGSRVEGVRIENNRFIRNLETGLFVHGASSVTIKDNRFQDQPTHVQVSEQTTDCQAVGNQMDDQGLVEWGPCAVTE